MMHSTNNCRPGGGHIRLFSILVLLFVLGMTSSSRIGGVEKDSEPVGEDVAAAGDSMHEEDYDESDYNEIYYNEIWDYEDEEEEEDMIDDLEMEEDDDLEPVWGIEQADTMIKEEDEKAASHLSFHAATENNVNQKRRGLLQVVGDTVSNGIRLLKYAVTGRVDFTFTSPDTGETYVISSQDFTRRNLKKYTKKCGRYNYRIYFLIFRQSMGIHVRPVNPDLRDKGCTPLNFYSMVPNPMAEWAGQPLRKKMMQLFAENPPPPSIQENFLRYVGTRKFRAIDKAFRKSPVNRPGMAKTGYNAAFNGAGALLINMMRTMGFPPATGDDREWGIEAMLRWENDFAQQLVDAGLDVPDFQKDDPAKYEREILTALIEEMLLRQQKRRLNTVDEVKEEL